MLIPNSGVELFRMATVKREGGYASAAFNRYITDNTVIRFAGIGNRFLVANSDNPLFLRLILLMDEPVA